MPNFFYYCAYTNLLCTRSTVKRCCNAYDRGAVRTAHTDLRKGPLARTSFSREDKPTLKPMQSSRKAGIDDNAFKRALKEQFQRDIDDTVKEIRSDWVNECKIKYDL